MMLPPSSAHGGSDGAVDINGGSYNPAAPFSVGTPKSGIGRELGRFVRGIPDQIAAKLPGMTALRIEAAGDTPNLDHQPAREHGTRSPTRRSSRVRDRGGRGQRRHGGPGDHPDR